MENFTPGVMSRFGLDYDAVKETNPRIIYALFQASAKLGPIKTAPPTTRLCKALAAS